jgi:hypothetical protein
LNLSGGEILKDRNEIEELIIMSIREPAADGYGMLRVKYIGRG